MSRIDELQKKYPTLARELIIKADLQRHGIRASEALAKVSYFQRRVQVFDDPKFDSAIREKLGGVPEGYQAQLAAASKLGCGLRVPSVYMKNGVGVNAVGNPHSPFEIREVEPGQFALFEGEEKVDDVYFPARLKPREYDGAVTSKGKPVGDAINVGGGCFYVHPVLYCEYFSSGIQCKFCSYFTGYYVPKGAATTQEVRTAGGYFQDVALSVQDATEAYQIIASSTQLVEGRFMMGAIRDNEKEVKIHLKFIEAIANVASRSSRRKPNLVLQVQPMSRKDMQRFRDAGLDCMALQWEVWDPEIFAEVCPGKQKDFGHDAWREAFLDAVEVFGPGNVGNNFVGGVTVMPENGHKTWQEARDSLIEGNRWLIKNGVWPIFTTLLLAPGSVYGDDPASVEKLVPTEYYLDAAIAHDKDCKEFGMYEKMNPLLYCPQDCILNVYGGQIHMLEKYGHIANFVARCFPEDENMLRQFPGK